MGNLDEKIALITAGTTGVGLATAKQFVAEGAYVFITGRRDRSWPRRSRTSEETRPAYRETCRTLVISMAKAVVFLASDDSSNITGTELFVDGGIAQV